MRLIDADELKKELYQQWFMDILLRQRNSEDIFYALAQKIDEQPTAYDVDKVVKQMEELEGRYNSVDFGIKGIICKAIEIVKSGGINHE